MVILPNQVFFDPTEEFIKFLCTQKRGIIDVGAGTGRLGRKLKEYGKPCLSIDLYQREEYESLVLTNTDTINFPFGTNQLLLFCRPSHGEWLEKVILKTLYSPVNARVFYIGLARNFAEDLSFAERNNLIVNLIIENAGTDGENCWEISPQKENRKKIKFGLVKLEDWDGPYWMEDKGGHWVNASGGGFNKGSGVQVLEECEVNDELELDWTKTALIREEDSNSGWLDREGKWYPCNSREHDRYAYYILRKNVGDLEKGGWVRVYGSPDSSIPWTAIGEGEYKRISKQQYRWLKDRGYKVNLRWD